MYGHDFQLEIGDILINVNVWMYGQLQKTALVQCTEEMTEDSGCSYGGCCERVQQKCGCVQ
jgi:hypothetical protein